MCGLCGIAGRIIENDKAFFRLLLFFNELRGEDATGVMRVAEETEKEKKKSGKELRVESVKQIGPPSYFLRYDHEGKKDKMLWRPSGLALLGHARHGTTGKRDSINSAHPFGFSKVVGMHNGTITTKFKHSDEYETDSEALYRNINDYGLEAALNEVAAYSSAYALTWVNKEDGTLNMIRNDKRPLHFGLFDYGSILAWASEEWMLRVAKRKFWDSDNQTPEIIEPKPNVLFTWHMTSNDVNWFKHPETKEIKIKQPTYHSYGPYKKSNHWHMGLAYEDGEGDVFDTEFESNTSATTEKKKPVINSNNEDLRPNKKGSVPSSGPATKAGETTSKGGSSKRFTFMLPGNTSIPRFGFAKLIDFGCAICGNAPSIDDDGVDSKIGWLDPETTRYICESCQSNEWAQDNLSWTKVSLIDERAI